MNLVTVEVFLKFELYLQLNLDLHLDSTKLGLGLGIVLGLDLARGQTGGAPLIDGFTRPRCLNNNRGTSLPPSLPPSLPGASRGNQAGGTYGRSGWRISKTGF